MKPAEPVTNTCIVAPSFDSRSCRETQAATMAASLSHRARMHIIAIAWLYIGILMSLTETSFIAGLATFVFYCALPLGVTLYVLSARTRRLRREARERAQAADRSPPTNSTRN